MKLKRVWDTTEKKIARVPWANWKPCQVWYGLETETYYKQDINGLVEITDEDFNVYWPNWKLVESDDVLGYYDTDEPTDLWNPEDWDEATYTFKDYDGTVLKTGKVKDWETPVAPADPTREHYTFQWWNPTLGPISKDTEFVAVYIPENYTITIEVSPEWAGSVDTSEVTVAYETPIEVEWRVLTIWENVEVIATAETGYVFSSWWELPETVTEDLTITATFEAAA